MTATTKAPKAPRHMTIKQAALAFGVSAMCLSHWRKGTATKEALPFETEGRNVLIPIAAAKKWAKTHGIEFAKDPASVVSSPDAAPQQPGPKKAKAH